MKRRSMYLLIGAAIVCLMAASYLIWSLALGAPLKVTSLRSGDNVTLQSGLSLIVPHQASGTLSRWRSPDAKLNNQIGLADDLILDFPGPKGQAAVVVSAYWSESSPALAVLKRATKVAGQSNDGSLEVRWTGSRAMDYKVFILSRLPGRRVGVVQIVAQGVTDPASALRAATDAWRRLHITGASLPAAST